MNQGDIGFDLSRSSSPIGDRLNVAAVCSGTLALGPGLRSVVWVQGCTFHCPGCIAPDWIPLKPANLITPESLVNELLKNPDITGLTFSGGEPMLQAAALARVAWLARAQREINIICFTGYQRAQLEKHPPVPGVEDLLSQVDVLIDGPYIEKLNDNQGMRGSSNQHIHYLTTRLKQADFEHGPRRSEIRLNHGQALMVGVPGRQMGEAFNRAVDQVRLQRWELLTNERV